MTQTDVTNFEEKESQTNVPDVKSQEVQTEIKVVEEQIIQTEAVPKRDSEAQTETETVPQMDAEAQTESETVPQIESESQTDLTIQNITTIDKIEIVDSMESFPTQTDEDELCVHSKVIITMVMATSQLVTKVQINTAHQK